MRKVAVAVVFLLAVVTAGFAFGGMGATPLIGGALGVTAVAMFVVSRVPTDRLLFLSLLPFIFTVTWTGLRGPGGAFGNVFLVLAFACLLAHIVATRHQLVLPPWLMLAGIGILLAQVLTLVFPPPLSLHVRESIELRHLYPTPPYLPDRSDVGALIKFEIALLVVPAMIMASGTTRYRCARFLDLFAAGVVVSAFVGILSLGGINVGPTPLIENRSAGLTLHPNYLGVGCSIAAPIVMLWLNRPDIRWRLAGFVALPMLLGGVASSGSRAGAVTVVLGVLLSTLAFPRLRRTLWLLVPIGAMIAVAVLAWTPAGHGVLSQLRLTHGSDVGGSNEARRYAADLALEQIRRRPLSGVGFAVIGDAHNIYLEILAAGGVVALVAFAVFMVGLLGTGRRGIRGPAPDESKVASLGVVIWLACGVVGNELADKFLYVVPGILLALSHLRATAPAEAPTAAERAAPQRPAPAPVLPPRVPVGV